MLPTDFQRVSSLYITTPVALSGDLTDYFIPVKRFRSEFPASGVYTGPLQYWTFWTSIEFYLKSSVAVTVVLDYIKYVPLLSSSSDVPVIPEAFSELLLLGAKMRIYENKEDFDYSAQFQNRYSDMMEAFVTRYSTRQVDNQMVVPGARRPIRRI